jgi:hypothetical protein
MKFSKNLLKILASYSTINQGILFQRGEIVSVISPLETIMSTCSIDTFIEQDFAISNLSEFINIIGLLSSDHEISFTDNQIVISSGNSVVKYTMADADTIKCSSYERPEYSDIITSFELPFIDMQNILKASSILKSSEIIISGKENGNVMITAGKINERSSSRFNKQMETIKVSPTKNFKRKFNLENFKIIEGNYVANIPEENFIELTGTNIDYWIAEAE